MQINTFAYNNFVQSITQNT